jgi:hypothetical protein
MKERAKITRLKYKNNFYIFPPPEQPHEHLAYKRKKDTTIDIAEHNINIAAMLIFLLDMD